MVALQTAHRLVPRGAVARLVLTAVLVSVLCAVAALAWAGVLARQQSADGAQARAGALVAGVVAPLVTPELLAGDDEARRRLEEAVHGRLQEGSVAGVEVRSGDGRVVFSADPSAGPSVAAGAVEVDLPLGRVAGTELVLATWLPSDGFSERLLPLAAPVVVLGGGGLALLLALQVPQTVRLTRALEQGEAARLSLAEELVRVRGEERERLLESLRDGVLQDLAGVGYLLDSLHPDIPDPSLRDVLTRASDAVRRDLSALRALGDEERSPTPG